MNKKHLWSILTVLAVMLLSVGFAACGGGDDDKKDDGYNDGSDYGVTLVPCNTCNGTGNCFICEGVGTEVCYVCNGTGVAPWKGYDGSYTCWSCDGTGRIECFLCSGSGKCNKCEGTGYIEDTSGSGDDYDWDDDDGSSGGSSGSSPELCHYCKGEKDCRNYVNTSNDKYYCHGSGKCKWCGGDGWTNGFGINNVPCANCNTPGKVGKSNTADTPGDGYCHYCGGSGRCGKCGGTGYK